MLGKLLALQGSKGRWLVPAAGLPWHEAAPPSTAFTPGLC